MNLHDLDPATLKSSPEWDVLIAEKWMGWHCPDGRLLSRPDWSPSTNPAHAGEAMLKSREWSLETIGHTNKLYGVRCTLNYRFIGKVFWTETNNDKGRTVALAITRAIVAAMGDAEETEGTDSAP